MLAAFGSLNYLAVLAAVIACVVVGFVWYMPPLFGRPWAERNSRYAGMTTEELLAPPPDRVPRLMSQWILAFAVNAVGLALLLRAAGVTTVAEAAVAGALVSLGFAATLSAWPVIFAKQPVGVWAINNGAFLVMQVVMSLILTIWR